MKFSKRKSKHLFLRLILLLVILGIGGFFFFNHFKKASAEWFDSSWFYRKAITVNVTSSSSDMTDLDTWFSMDTSSLISANKLQSNCQDLRFTSANGKVLPYYIDSGCNTTSTKIWVRADLVPKNTTAYTMYAYYGNPSATPGSDENKFNLYKGLVGYWNMNESSGAGSGLSDFSVNNSTATAKLWGGGNTSTDSAHVVGKYGNSFSFDGGDDYIITPYAPSYVSGSEFTMSLWFKTTTTLTTPRAMIGAITTNVSGNPLLRIEMGEGGAGIVRTSIRGTAGNRKNITASGTWNDGNWHMVTIVRNSSNQVSIYLDAGNQSSDTVDPIITLAGYPFYIGATNANNVVQDNSQFPGSIDDVRIYSRALSFSEISQLYSATSSILTAVKGQVAPTTTFASEEKSPYPVAYWKFDEGQGATAYDQSSNNNHGTISGATWQTEDMCITGKCLKFDGTDDYVDAGNGASLNISNAITLEAWVKPNSFNNYGTIIGKSINNGYELEIEQTTGKFKSVFNISGSVCQDLSNTALTAGKWNHVVIAFDGNDLKYYLNGLSDGTFNHPGTIATNNNPVLIGARTGSTSQPYIIQIPFNGFIDDVKIYPYARTASQIKADYNAGKSGAGGSAKSASIGNKTQDWMSNGLVGYWKMDESSSPSVDSSGSGNNGTWVGSVSAASGKFGNGITLDGDGDYLSITTINTAKTQAGWFNFSQSASDKGNFNKLFDNLFQHNANNYIYISGTNDLFYFAPAVNTWYYIVFTYPSTSDDSLAKLYVNGISYSVHQQSGSHDIDPITVISSSGANQGFKGKMDEVRIYDHTLSPKEVSDLYNWAPGPVGWWKMDDKVSGNSKTVVDSSGNGNNGTTYYGANTTGMDCTKVGKYGSACQFDGTDDYVDVGNNSMLNITGAITIEAWVKPNSILSNHQMIFNRGLTGTDGYQFLIYYNSGKLCAGTFNDNYQWFCNSGSIVPIGRWSHVTFVRTDAGVATFYINGIVDLVGSLAAPKSASRNATIGSYGAVSYPFNGPIDDVRVYNYARTQKQILEDMNAGHPVVGSPVGSYAAYWKFDEGKGSTAYDQSVNANNGTISGATWTNNGKFGRALNFDGINDDINIGSGTSLKITDKVTVSAWVNKTIAGADDTKGILGISSNENDGITAAFYSRNTANWEVRMYTGSASLSRINLPSALFNINKWQHLAFTYDSSTSTFKYYVNGVEYTDQTYVGGSIAPNGSIYYAGTPTGKIGYTRNGAYFTGLIDEVKIYPLILTADDIKTEYNRGKSIVMGSLSNTVLLTGGSVASNSASAQYCIPGDTATCNPPVGEWLMNDHSGGYAYDTSGNNNTGTLTNGPTWQSANVCHSGSCLKFDGVDDYVDAGNGANLNFGSGNFTMEMWLKSNTYTNAYPLSKRIVAGYWFYAPQSGPPGFYIRDATSGNIGVYGSNNVYDNRWHHLVGVRNNSYLYFYVDGVLAGSPVDVSSVGSIDVSTNLRIGAYDTNYWNGMIDDVRFFNYARSAAQIAWDYNRGGPVGYWKMNECQGSTLIDSSGNGNNGTVVIGALGTQDGIGTCTDGDTSNAWYNGRSGKYNSAMSFDGTDDYVDIPHNSILNPSSTITIEAWIKPNGSILSYPTIISKTNNAYTLQTCEEGLATGTSVSFWINNQGNGNTCLPDAKIYYGNWYHVVVTYDGSTAKQYHNGKLIYTQSFSTTMNSSASVVIGGYPSVGNRWNGLIDEAKVYNYALTAEQIKLNYNQGAAVRFAPITGRP